MNSPKLSTDMVRGQEYLVIGNRTVSQGAFIGRDKVNPKLLWFIGADGKKRSVNLSYVDEVREL